jgi:exodeoxyribonuclease-1
VFATIAVARLVRDRQLRLYDYLLSHRDKRSAMEQLDVPGMKPVLHVSGMFGASRHNIALIVPLALHPVNKNEILCFDLASDPAPLFDLSPEELAARLYTRSEDLPEGQERLGLKTVHLNRCPVLLPAKMADPATAKRLRIDGETCRRHLALLREHAASHTEEFTGRLQAIYRQRQFDEVTDPDRMLYGGGFFGDNDKQMMDQLRALDPYELAQTQFAFEDRRLPEMLFRYRARNFPDTLTPEERALWEEYRYARLTEPEYGASLCMEEFHAEIEARQDDPATTPGDRALLEDLLAWADQLLA